MNINWGWLRLVFSRSNSLFYAIRNKSLEKIFKRKYNFLVLFTPPLPHNSSQKIRGKYRNYSYEDLERAKEAIINGASITKTAHAFGIPYNTLYSFKGKISPTKKQLKLFSALWHQPPPPSQT